MKKYFKAQTKKVLFFDWNHTLVDQKLAFRKYFVQLLDEFAGRWSEQHQWNATNIYRQYEREWKRLKSGRRNLKPEKLRHICLRKVLKPYPFDLSDRFVRMFFRELRARQRQRPLLFPQTGAVLQHLSQHYRLALISNGSLTSMKELDLHDYFPENHLFTAGKYGVKKPNPELFRKALAGMGVSAREAVMIGNSWRNDIQGALRADIDAIWLKKGMSGLVRNKKGCKVVRIQSIGELKHIF